MPVATIRDMRARKMCIPITKKFLNDHGYPWKRFVKEGVDTKILRSFNDAMATKLAIEIELEHSNG